MNVVKFFTKRMRASKAIGFIRDAPGSKLLDIACGDGFFLKKFHRTDAIGIDLERGHDVEKGLEFPDSSFDYVTLLAAIEHFIDPWKVLGECHRVLKDKGTLVITTPFKKADKIIKLYAHHSRHDPGMAHIHYFTREDFESVKGFDLVHYSTFALGFNQLVVLRKK